MCRRRTHGPSVNARIAAGTINRDFAGRVGVEAILLLWPRLPPMPSAAFRAMASSMNENLSAFIADATARLGSKAVITGPADIEPWVTDWRGRVHGASSALLAPASTEEVAELVKLATEHRVPLVPQGGNTGMAGGATPPADGSAVLLTTRRMKRIRSISAEDRLAVAEAGVVLSDLHD